MDLNTGPRLAEYAEMTRKGSEAFWVRMKKWFIVAAIVGLLVGLFVTMLDQAVLAVWGAASSHINSFTVVLFPTVGLLLSGLILQYFTLNSDIHGTEEVIEVFHERGGVFRFRSFPGKILASIATLGFGGSAGLEGPAIYAGGAVGSFVLRKIRRWGFTDEDVRTLMVAGAAAGVSAIFKAPLTGIIFALEVPYRDDITREALIPSLVSSVVSYLVLVQFLGVEPLFRVSERYTMTPRDLFYAIILGLVVGLVARVFVYSYHQVGRIARESGLPLWVRTGLGGLVCGLLGLASFKIFGEPLVLGTGYEGISGLMAGSYSQTEAVQLLFLKTGATVATLATGAAGGIFIPMIMLGADLGVIVRGFLPGAVGPMFPVVGMAAFLAAGYNTPIAATVFIAETTGGAGYIIPGLVAAAVAFSIAGRVSVSENQRWRRENRVDRLMGLRVADIMTHDVDIVHSNVTVEEFVTDHIVHMRHKSLPVLDAAEHLVGMVGLTDIGEIPREDWSELVVADVMMRNLEAVTRDMLVGDLVSRMAETDIDRMPVVESDDATALVGIVSSTDVLALDDVCADWRRRRRAADLVARRRTRSD